MLSKKDRLSIDDLRQMNGLPVWCETIRTYGIVSVASIGPRAGRPFLLGVDKLTLEGISTTTFMHDIERARLTCYRLVLPYE